MNGYLSVKMHLRRQGVNMLIYPRYLSFEVTRRCNLNCKHCMRGNSQDLDMSEEIVKRTLDSIPELYYINFTGGEPSLNTKLIEFIIDELKRRAIKVYGFDVVSNVVDTNNINNLIRILSNFKTYCFDDRVDTSRLAISIDEYHKFMELPTQKCNFTLCYKKELEEVLNLGRAKDLNCKKTSKDANFINVIRQYGTDTIMLGNSIVVSANGDVRLSVDYEYSSTDDVIGNVLENSLGDIISKEIERAKDSWRRRSWE